MAFRPTVFALLPSLWGDNWALSFEQCSMVETARKEAP